MTFRTWVWGGNYRWLLLVLILPVAPLLFYIATDPNQSTTSRFTGSGTLIATYLWIGAFHNWITIAPGHIRVGFFSLYRRTIPLSEIRDVRRVTIHPFRQFGGTGIKGLAKSKNGLLLGGNPTTGLRFETFDGRAYTCTFQNLEPIITALERQGCTLSAEHGDASYGKV